MADTAEKRVFRRYPIYWPVEYRPENQKLKETTVTLNISEGGALLSTNRFVDVATNLIVKLFIKGEDFFLKSRVVHIQKSRPDGIYEMGVEFMQKSSDFVRKFYEEVSAIEHYQSEYSKEAGKEISMVEAQERWYNRPEWF